MLVRPTSLGSSRSKALRALFGSLLCLACAEPAGPGPGEVPPAPVEVGRTHTGTLTEDWVFVGRVRSLETARLAPGAGGEVVMIDVREGDRVEAGELLVELDERAAQARLRAARSTQRESDKELAQARRDADRAKALGSHVVAEAEIERETSRAETLEARKRRYGAEFDAVRAELLEYRVVAPFAGVVSERLVDLGQWVDPGGEVLELVAVDRVEILVDVRPELASHLRVGGDARLRPTTAQSAESRGEAAEVGAKIMGVVPALDERTRTIKVRLSPNSTRTWLMPGAPVEVAFPVEVATAGLDDAGAQAVIVPQDALVLGAIDVRVIEIVDGVAKPIVVEVLARAGEEAVVRGAGLGADAVVVTRGNERLRPGQSVRVIEEPSG